MTDIAERTPNEPPFVYVAYIRTTPDALWRALTTSEFTARYWSGVIQETEWRVGGSVRFLRDGELIDSGEVLEFDPPRRLAYTFKPEWNADLAHLPPGRVSFGLERDGQVVKLTLVHDHIASPVIRNGVGRGWPMVISTLKTLLETGEAFSIGERSRVGEDMARVAAETRNG